MTAHWLLWLLLLLLVLMLVLVLVVLVLLVVVVAGGWCWCCYYYRVGHHQPATQTHGAAQPTAIPKHCTRLGVEGWT